MDNNIKKNETYTAEIIGYSSTGAGVCRIEGRAVFVKNALKGELWEILILKVSASAVYGKGTKLLKASPERRKPDCPVFGNCGGCDLMHMSYEEELRFKLARVNDAIKHVGGLDFTVGEILGADEGCIYRYRNKGIYALGHENNGRAAIGFYRGRTHELVAVSDCLIQTELSVRCSATLREFMEKEGVSAYDEASRKGQIRHLFTRCSTKYRQSVAVVISTEAIPEYREALISCFRESCPELTGIVLCINKASGNRVLGGQFKTLWGSEFIEDELCGLKFRISPESFYQINPRQAERLYDIAVNYASPDGDSTVLDLYCGIGTISLCLALRAKKVYGAEIVKSAVDNAILNAEVNGIKNAEFILGDAKEAAVSLAKAGVLPDAVVLDPPRKGLDEELIASVAVMSPERVVYVSCDPGTLARDLKRFAALGYSPQKAVAVDMFPRCSHVETVVLMSRIDE